MGLDELIAQAIDDPSKERDVFSRLLESVVYVHAPKDSTGQNLSIVQFKTPQGFWAIPVFTDKTKADVAAREKVRVVAAVGRELLQATLGASIVVNPNDAWCILYPEEIRILLQGGNLGRTPESLILPKDTKLRCLKEANAEFVELAFSILAPVEEAIDAWLTECAEDDTGPASGYVVIVAAEKPYHERIARHLTIAFSEHLPRIEKVVDVTFVEPGETHDAWLSERRDCLIFRRAWLPCLASGCPGHA